MKRHEALFTKSVKPGAVIKCGNNDDGIRIEVCKNLYSTPEKQVVIRLGSPDNPRLFVDKQSCTILRDFFIELEKTL